MKAIYGRKVGMTRLFTEEGDNVPVTVLELGPNTIQQIKTPEKEGYHALQIGFLEQKPQRVNRPLTGHLAKAKKGSVKFLGEIRLDSKLKGGEVPEYKVGDQITLEGMFEKGSKVDVVGKSIGKGFAGVIKRWNMSGAQTVTHGTHENFRHAGSIGCRKFPGRVWKNKHMAGQMGGVRVMQEGLEVMAIRPEENVLLVKGSVPGAKDSYVYVRESLKR